MRPPPPTRPVTAQRLLLWMVVVLLLGVAGAVATWAWARDRYLKELSFRAQQNGPTFQGVFGSTNGIPVLFLGDSRMVMWPAFPQDKYRTFNAGGYGEVTAQVLHRTPSALALSQPRLVVVQAGINDLKILGLGSGRDADIPRDCVAHLTNIVGQCVASNALVVWTPIFPVGPKDLQRKLIWSSQIDHHRVQVNAEVRKALASWGDKVIILDSDQWMEGDLARHYLDTLHLNGTAYEKLQADLTRALSGRFPPLVEKPQSP